MVHCMSTQYPVPLFPTYKNLRDFAWSDYKETYDFLLQLPDWCLQQWDWSAEYLRYLGRNKSEHTFIRFRSEIEKYLLWSFLVARRPVDMQRKADILDYTEFFFKPPQSWITLTNADKFLPAAGGYRINPAWRPFRYIAKGDIVDTKRYRPSQKSIKAMFSAIGGFFTFLMENELVIGNPVPLAKKDCRRLQVDAQIQETSRLDAEQWEFLLETARAMADEDPLCERHLFLVAAMKALFLRISELSEREGWSPVMGHFWQDNNKNWWLKVYGKGNKIRDVSVPDDFFSYLERYRRWRGLPPTPGRHEQEPIVEKIRGAGGMTARHLSRLVHEVLDRAYHGWLGQRDAKSAQIFRDVTPHWLRHTGASMEIERGRPLKDVSEDLGHASMATTDKVYIQSSARQRAASGKKREV